MHRLPAFCPNRAPFWLLMVWVGRPENAAHRQAAVRNWQGCERITPHSRALSGLGAPPAHDRPHISAAQDPAPGPLFGQEEGALERPPFRDAAIGLASARAYLGLRGAFATLTRQGWAAGQCGCERSALCAPYTICACIFAVRGPYSLSRRRLAWAIKQLFARHSTAVCTHRLDSLGTDKSRLSLI